MLRRPLCYLCVTFVAVVFIYLKLNPLPETPLVETVGNRVTFLGEVCHKEYKNEKLVLYLKHIKKWDSQNSSIIFYDKDINNKELYKDVNIMCYTSNSSEPKLGSEVAVTGTVQLFNSPTNPGEFNAELYYKILGLDFVIYKADIIAESKMYSKYYEGLYQVRRYFEKIFEAVLPQKEASVMKAMVLGNKAELDENSSFLYQKGGVSHIIAISGLHISLIGMTLHKILRKTGVPVIISSTICVVLMILYGDMAGMSSSAFRAIFMFGIKLLAETVYRTYDMLTAAAIAAVLLLAEQPLYLYHSGFLLSFGAILGLGCFSKTLGGSLSVFVIHFPVMLFTFYEFSPYSFILNLIVIPSMSVLVPLGVLCLLAGVFPIYSIGMGVAYVMGTGCKAILYIFEKMCELSLALPGANCVIGKPEDRRIYIFYIVILVLFVLQEYCKYLSKNTKSKKYKKFANNEKKLNIHKIIQFIIILSVVLMLTIRPVKGLEITFVDVGQGDCIFIEAPTGKHYLIDGGSSSKNSVGKYTIIPYLKYKGIDRIDAVFLTHLDNDHISGIIEFLENGKKIYLQNGIRIDCIVISEAVIRNETYEKISELCESCGIKLIFANTGDMISQDNFSLTVLHPKADYKTDSTNAYSLVLKLDYVNEYGHFGVLFTGDVEEDGEKIVADYFKNTDWECDLLKASHHGSKNSNTKELLQVLKPKLTVISCGKNNVYGHPHKETLERLDDVGSRVITTKDSGAVTVKVGREIEVERFNE